MNFKSLEELVSGKNKQISRWIFVVLIYIFSSLAVLIFICYYQQNNLNSLNNEIENVNKRVSTSVSIPKDELIRKINTLQKDIDTLKIEDATKKDLSSKIIELKINDLPTTVVSSERLTLDKDLIALRKEVVKEQNGVVSTLIQAFSGLFLFTTVVFSALNLKETKDKQISERFIQAVGMLGADCKKKDVILGGVYALERIAKDSEKDHWVIMEVLTAFVRQKAQYQNTGNNIPKKVDIEVQAALTVIGRRDSWKEQEEQKLDLTHLCLLEANLQKAKLGNVDFTGSILRGTNFEGSYLRNAKLINTDLNKACFKDADLLGANLTNAIHADIDDAKFKP